MVAIQITGLTRIFKNDKNKIYVLKGGKSNTVKRLTKKRCQPLGCQKKVAYKRKKIQYRSSLLMKPKSGIFKRYFIEQEPATQGAPKKEED